MTEVRPGEQIEDKSLGTLVAEASSGVSRLIKSEMELAKMELAVDAKKALTGTALFSVAVVVLAPVIILLAIAFAYGLVALGIWHWAAFLIVAAVYTLVAALLGLIGYRYFRRIKGATRTRRTLRDLPGAFRPDHKGKTGRDELPDAGKPALTD
jgi:uncharacterized membrane protein YqjE